MEMLKKWKNNILTRWKSTKEKNSSKPNNTLPKYNSYSSWCNASPSSSSSSSSSSMSSSNRKAKRLVAPRGCFSVYVGSERQRFVMKAKYANHPLFMMLLDDAHQQHGYYSEGPILLPCEVDFFCKVLAEIDSDATDIIPYPGCGGYGSYGLLSSSKLFKLNHV